MHGRHFFIREAKEAFLILCEKVATVHLHAGCEVATVVATVADPLLPRFGKWRPCRNHLAPSKMTYATGLPPPLPRLPVFPPEIPSSALDGKLARRVEVRLPLNPPFALPAPLLHDGRIRGPAMVRVGRLEVSSVRLPDLREKLRPRRLAWLQPSGHRVQP